MAKNRTARQSVMANDRSMGGVVPPQVSGSAAYPRNTVPRRPPRRREELYLYVRRKTASWDYIVGEKAPNSILLDCKGARFPWGEEGSVLSSLDACFPFPPLLPGFSPLIICHGKSRAAGHPTSNAGYPAENVEASRPIKAPDHAFASAREITRRVAFSLRKMSPERR